MVNDNTSPIAKVDILSMTGRLVLSGEVDDAISPYAKSEPKQAVRSIACLFKLARLQAGEARGLPFSTT
jgi:hypothetical protein